VEKGTKNENLGRGLLQTDIFQLAAVLTF